MSSSPSSLPCLNFIIYTTICPIKTGDNFWVDFFIEHIYTLHYD